MRSNTKWIVAIVTVIALLIVSVADDADGRRCRRRRRCRPRPPAPAPVPPSNRPVVIDGGSIEDTKDGASGARVFDQGVKRIVDVDVEVLGLSQMAPDSLTVALSKRGGPSSRLMSGVGGSGSTSDVSLNYDDEAARALPDDGPLVTGRFKPTLGSSSGTFDGPTTLSVFDGFDPEGDWILTTTAGRFSRGSITGWRLILTLEEGAGTPPPPPVIQPPPSGVRSFRGEAPLTILDDNVIAAAVDVPPLDGRVIGDIDVVFEGLTHSAIQDLDIKLENPSRIREVVLMSDVGTGPVNNVTFKLSDEALRSLPDAGPIENEATYRPRNVDTGDAFGSPDVLSEFDGTDPVGRWILTITDDEPNDVGSLAGWSIVVALD